MTPEKLWKLAVLKRANGLCERCLSQGGISLAIDAHHAIHKTQGDYIKYCLDIGVALCRHCHDLDGTGQLRRWCVEHIGEDVYYEAMRINSEHIANKSFNLEDAVRSLKNYLGV